MTPYEVGAPNFGGPQPIRLQNLLHHCLATHLSNHSPSPPIASPPRRRRETSTAGAAMACCSAAASFLAAGPASCSTKSPSFASPTPSLALPRSFLGLRRHSSFLPPSAARPAAARNHSRRSFSVYAVSKVLFFWLPFGYFFLCGLGCYLAPSWDSLMECWIFHG